MTRRADRILLVGMMGAGKSTVGALVARALGWRYLDNDELLRRATGRSARDAQQADVRTLRRAESAALSVALTEAPPLVASIAAGVVLDPLDRDRLRAGGFVVWLRVPIAHLADRVRGTGRPWVGDDPDAALSSLYAGRAALYASVADLVVDADAAPPDVIAQRVITAAAPRPSGS